MYLGSTGSGPNHACTVLPLPIIQSSWKTPETKACNHEEGDHEWLCAGRYIKQSQSVDCVTAHNQSHWEEVLVRLLNNQTLEDREDHGSMVVSLTACQLDHSKQKWNGVTQTVNASEGRSICKAPGGNSSSHAILHCYIEDMEYQTQRWTTCCKPQSCPATYARCYDHQVESAGEIGVHACNLPGYHMYKTDCTRMNCLEKVTYCI